jgi:putative ABC transport system permease protein
MLKKLALRNIVKRPFRSFLTCLSIAIGTGSILIFLSINQGIKNATFEEIEKQSPLTQITVKPEVKDGNLISLLGKASNSFSAEDIEKIKNIDGIEEINPEIQFNNFSSVEASILGMSLITDTMIFGVPEDFIKEELSTPEDWQRMEAPYPVIIHRKILDLYNVSIAIPQNLPTLSEENLIGKSLTFLPNYSTFFPAGNEKNTQVELEVVGFSDKVSLIGLTMPYPVVEKLNLEFSENNEIKILQLFVETSDPTKTEGIAKEIEVLGFKTQYFQKNLQDVEAKFDYLNQSLVIISFIILLSSAIAIMSTFLATISERTRELGLFRALGAKKSHIRKLILMEAGILGVLGSIFGIILGLIFGQVINSYAIESLSDSLFHPSSLFQVGPKLIIFTFIFGVLISLLTVLIPANRAASISPISALKKN